ncbi:hypothetical protein BDZ91DRAFT_758693 [Kalaharituber pfeilii]|nr:hypothetical protein BDZ91DRAFT_758693 [Kalaharituber pfeilii]
MRQQYIQEMMTVERTDAHESERQVNLKKYDSEIGLTSKAITEESETDTRAELRGMQKLQLSGDDWNHPEFQNVIHEIHAFNQEGKDYIYSHKFRKCGIAVTSSVASGVASGVASSIAKILEPLLEDPNDGIIADIPNPTIDLIGSRLGVTRDFLEGCHWKPILKYFKDEKYSKN